MGCFTIWRDGMSTILHNIDLTRLQSICVFISHFICTLKKQQLPARSPPLYAVDRQTSSSKMLINLTGSAAMLGRSDLKFRLMNWSTARLSRWVRLLYQFRPLFQGNPTPRLISHCHSHTRLHMTFHFLLLVKGEAMSEFASEAEKQSGNSAD